MKMNKVMLLIILGMMLLVGPVAANELYGLSENMTIPSEVFSGNSFSANFSFSYLDWNENENGSALIIKLNITSGDQTNFPVDKDNFVIQGYTEKCTYNLFGLCLFPKTIYFSCSEDGPLTIEHSRFGNTTLDVPDGIFYCFNESNDLSLNEGNNIFLDMASNLALWPGQYNLNATLFYLNDTANPMVLILNKSYFDQYFRDGSYVDFQADIYDAVGLSNYYAKMIISPLQNISFSKELVSGDTYYFYQTLPNKDDMPEGNYPLIVSAIDTSGNIGIDSTTIKIDETSPEITLIQPTNNSIHDEMVPIELFVFDEKAGVDSSSVRYRIREIINGSICPEAGIGFNFTCYNSGWLPAEYNITSGNYHSELNTTSIEIEDGKYWFESKAKDILGNEGVFG